MNKFRLACLAILVVFVLLFARGDIPPSVAVATADAPQSPTAGEFAVTIPIGGGSAIVRQATNGGYIVARSNWIAKLDYFGGTVWQRSFVNVGFEILQPTADNGFIAASGAQVTKLDNSGNVVWAKTYQGSNLYSFTSIQQTNDGGYIASAHWSNILKLDSSGNIVWQKQYGIEDQIN